MKLSKWQSHHYNLTLVVVLGAVAGVIYWQGVQASSPNKTPFDPGTRITAVANVNVYDRANDKAGTLLCVQPAGSTGAIMDGPKSGRGTTWAEVNWDSYCDGWIQVDGFMLAQ